MDGTKESVTKGLSCFASLSLSHSLHTLPSLSLHHPLAWPAVLNVHHADRGEAVHRRHRPGRLGDRQLAVLLLPLLVSIPRRAPATRRHDPPQAGLVLQQASRARERIQDGSEGIQGAQGGVRAARRVRDEGEGRGGGWAGL